MPQPYRVQITHVHVHVHVHPQPSAPPVTRMWRTDLVRAGLLIASSEHIHAVLAATWKVLKDL